jgi:hypothetical protein
MSRAFIVVVATASLLGRCVTASAPSAPPLAIILDTSSYARDDFQSLREAVQKFVERLSPREIAVYTSGAPTTRVEDFTQDRNRISHAVASTFSAPRSTTHTLETIRRASKDLRRLNAPEADVVVLSAGGLEMNPPDVQQVLPELQASHAVVYLVELRTLRPDGKSPRLQRNDGDVFELLSARTHGKYVHGTSAAVYTSGLDAIAQQLDEESRAR